MARSATVYRAEVELADADRGRYQTLATTIAQHPSETAERRVLRLLAWCLCYDEELQFTRGICAGDEPDLWRLDAGGRPLLWVEVGQPPATRLLQAARRADQVVLLAASGALHRWEREELPRLSAVANVSVYAVDGALVSALAADPGRTLRWSLTVSGSMLYLTAGGRSHEAPLTHLAGPPLP